LKLIFHVGFNTYYGAPPAVDIVTGGYNPFNNI